MTTESTAPTEQPTAAPPGPPAPGGLTPYLCVSDARSAIDWYTRVLGAEISYQPIVMGDGRVGHVELTIGGSRLMMADPFDEVGVAPPDPTRGSPVSLHLTVDDVGAVVERARSADASIDRGPEESDHGRAATVTDPFGHRWLLNGN